MVLLLVIQKICFQIDVGIGTLFGAHQQVQEPVVNLMCMFIFLFLLCCFIFTTIELKTHPNCFYICWSGCVTNLWDFYLLLYTHFCTFEISLSPFLYNHLSWRKVTYSSSFSLVRIFIIFFGKTFSPVFKNIDVVHIYMKIIKLWYVTAG